MIGLDSVSLAVASGDVSVDRMRRVHVDCVVIFAGGGSVRVTHGYLSSAVGGWGA
jgi:hypothetical protein